MDKKAARPALSQEKNETSMSTPASSPRNSTRGTQAQTEDYLESFDDFDEDKRANSPPPVGLEKAMDPSLGSQPQTPALSSTSCLSRSSTLNSLSTTQTQESDTTEYSQSSSFSDDTTSLYRSLTLPSTVSYPVGRKPLHKGANIHLFELPKALFEHRPVFPYPSGVSVPMEQSSFGRMNRHLTWPDRQDEGRPAHSHQSSPLRHLTFPIERPRNPTLLHDTQSFMIEGPENRLVPEPSNMSGVLPENVSTSNTDMCYDSRKEMPPNEVGFYNSHMQTEIFVNRSLIASDHWMFGAFDSKHDDLYCEVAANPSTECVSQRRQMLSRKMPLLQGRKSAERAKNVASQLHRTYGERQHSPECAMFSSANTLVTSDAAEAPKHINGKEFPTPTETSRELCSSSPSPHDKPCGESNRESSSSDSDDNAQCPHEDSSPAREEDEDSTYDELVEGITNLVLESSCVGNIEDRGVPVKLYVHNLLENILNHPKSPHQSQPPCLPIRSPPTPSNGAPNDAGESGMRAGGRPGNGGGSGTNKRKNDEASGHYRNGSYGCQDSFDEDFGEMQSHSAQKVKKPRTGKQGGNFSCPFRKRNPLRFNVRDHGSCALNPFTDFALLKRHIKTFHQKPNSTSSCVRCKEQFPDQAALNHHLTRLDICPVRDLTGDEDPEDGVTEEVDRALKVRTKDDNVRSWESLWNLLFPMDRSERIPGPAHEPPVELEELQEHFDKEDSIRQFFQQQAMDGGATITNHTCGSRYIVHGIWRCRDTHSHEHSERRLEWDRRFVDRAHNAFCTRQIASQAQQARPTEVCDPPPAFEQPRWGDDLNEPFSLGDFDLYASLSPYPTEPPYASHVGVNGPHVPAPVALYPSSEHGSAYHAAPQHAPTNLPYGRSGMLPQNGSPCPTAEGSAHRSSRPSSQSLNSSYQTQETQDTQYTQQSAAAFPHHHPDDWRPGDHGGACSCSTSPVGIPGQVPSAQNLWGIGTKPVTRTAECLDGSNSDEDLTLGSIPDMS